MPLDKLALYRCPICDTVVEVLDGCGVELVCCGPQMSRVNVDPATNEDLDHTLIVRWKKDLIKVRVGTTPHSMCAEHHIAWIELTSDQMRQRRFLSPEEAPTASFAGNSETVKVRAFCSRHGLIEAVRSRMPQAYLGKASHANASVTARSEEY